MSKLRSGLHGDQLSAELTERKVDHDKDGNWFALTHMLKRAEFGRLSQLTQAGDMKTWKKT